MKIRFYLATAIVALSWMGCSQEETTSEIMSGANTIQATIESTSRSAVTEAGVFSWATGDQITLVEETGGGVMRDTYTYSGSGDAFTPPTPTTVTTPVVAYYPAHDSHTATKFYLPASYGSTSEEYVADTHAAMMATPPASGNTYAFMHLGGVMRFNVKNVPVGVHTFRLTIPWKQINGGFLITENSDGEKIIATGDAAIESSFNVQIHFKALTEAKDMTFYVPLPTGTYGDYKVGLINGTTSIEHNSTGVSNTINRKTLLLMPTFTYDGTKLVKGEAIAGVIDLEAGNQSAEISADAEVMVTSGTDADATATLNYTPAVDGSSVLSLSDGSGATESGDSEGKVVVSTTSGSTVASCEINTPSLTVELAAAENGTVTFNEVTALTAEQTLIIGKGVTVTTLNIKGGNVVIEEGATVENIVNPGNRSVEYRISTATGLKWLAEQVNAGNTFSGYTFKLTADIDLNNEQWTPIGYWETFDGTFDGDGHTISNLKHHATELDCYIGLFGCTNNATIKNLTISNADIKLVGDDSWAGGHIGAVVGYPDGASVLENIKLTGTVKIEGAADKKGGQRIGAVVGGFECSSLTMKNITVNVSSESYVKGYLFIGGVAGSPLGTVMMEKVSSNIQVLSTSGIVGGIIGYTQQGSSFIECSSSGTVNRMETAADATYNQWMRIGGIIGSWGSSSGTVTLKTCSYTGTLSCNDNEGNAVTEFLNNGLVGQGYFEGDDEGEGQLIIEQ